MDDLVRAKRIFGTTSKERKATILAVAAELKESGKVQPNRWRGQLSQLVAEECSMAHGGHYLVYSYIGYLGSAVLKEIRVACVGEEFEKNMRRGRPKKGKTVLDAELAQRKLEWSPRFVSAIVTIMAQRKPLSKAAIARAAAGEQNFRVAYQVIGAFSNHELMLIGYPRLGTYFPDPVCGNGSTGPSEDALDDEPAETDESRSARIREEYETAIKSLSPNERTRSGLAGRMGKASAVVNSFLYQNPDLAGRLTDGMKVFKGFLKKTG
ncbi:hypothetical protein HY970_00375 [Candidatus Kaiserbacteria bacterium]|nr:hypothetical protein [Candidatus Kaiserbacteria bacterium]